MKGRARKDTVANSTPQWVDAHHRMIINQFYNIAQMLNDVTGLKHEVDHIVPLKGKLVSGLNVCWNMQILRSDENRIKGNKFDVN